MQVVRHLLIAVIAITVAVSSVACSIDGVPVATKAIEAPLTKLMPLNANDVGTPGAHPEQDCDQGTVPVILTAHLGTGGFVDHTDRVWVKKKNPASMATSNSEAVYEFNNALPEVRNAIVTFGTETRVIPGTPWVTSTDVSYRATWPKEATTGPVRVSMKSHDFAGIVQMAKALLLCFVA